MDPIKCFSPFSDRQPRFGQIFLRKGNAQKYWKDATPTECVVITKAEYDKLLRDARWLQYLEYAGIYNTNAYSYARETAAMEGFFGDDEER